MTGGESGWVPLVAGILSALGTFAYLQAANRATWLDTVRRRIANAVAPKPVTEPEEEPEPERPLTITWDEIEDRSYTCPDVSCLLQEYEPSPAAKSLPEVKAWMDRLNKQMNFQLGSFIDNATKQTMQKWMIPIYGAIRGGEGERPNLYRLYTGEIESLELKRAGVAEPLTEPADDGNCSVIP